jgi:hypothetical protein
LSGADVEACGIDAQLRPETLAPEQFGRLAVCYEGKRAADSPARDTLKRRGAREG